MSLASSSTPITPVEAGITWFAGSRRSCAADRQQASATVSPVRVAQLALPAFTRIAPTAPREAARCLAAELHRRRLHAVLREDAGGCGGQAGNDQRQIVLLGLAYAGVRGGVAIA